MFSLLIQCLFDSMLSRSQTNLMRFVLNNPAGIYYPEDFINGYFTLETRAPLNVDKIVVKLLGQIIVQFPHTNCHGKVCRCSSVETLIDKALFVWMQQGSQCLPARSHVFPIKFYLPRECPPSYSSDYGSIKYTLKAEIHAKGGLYKFCKTAITVQSACDLDTNTFRSMSVSTLSLFVKPKVCFHGIMDFPIPASVVGYRFSGRFSG